MGASAVSAHTVTTLYQAAAPSAEIVAGVSLGRGDTHNGNKQVAAPGGYPEPSPDEGAVTKPSAAAAPAIWIRAAGVPALLTAPAATEQGYPDSQIHYNQAALAYEKTFYGGTSASAGLVNLAV